MNWTIIIIVSVLALALVVFLIIRNQKDEEKFEETIMNNYPHPRDEEGDTNSNDTINKVH
jgi:flagellar biosynthesis/type III secretory pathway M-ring protein FliF/YscJ